MSQIETTSERITDLLDQFANTRPDAPAATLGDDTLSYSDLKRARNDIAKGLMAIGVKPGDRVAMIAHPSNQFWIALHAVTSIGATWVGVNPVYQERDFESAFSAAVPKALLIATQPSPRDYASETQRFMSGRVTVSDQADANGETLSFDDLVERGKSVTQAELLDRQAGVDPEDIAVIVFTSGTTGTPKGAMLSHRALASSARANGRWMTDASMVCGACVSPVNHVGALTNVCMNLLACGGHIVFHPGVDLEAIVKIGEVHQPTFMQTSPTGFSMMLAHGGFAEFIDGLRLIVFGGAMTAESTLAKVAKPGLMMSSVYGQSETCGIVTYTDPADDIEVHGNTIGHVLPGAELRIADEHEQSVRDGEAGEIQIRGPYCMSGYFNNPEATDAAFTSDGFLRTGDIGKIREDGNVVFVGRLKEMFKSGGYNVYPVEIEQAICEHPAVALAAVLDVPHPTFQEVGHAIIQPKPGQSVTDQEIEEFLRSRIANYKVPKSFQTLEAMPLLPNGKIDKVALRETLPTSV